MARSKESDNGKTTEICGGFTIETQKERLR